MATIEQEDFSDVALEYPYLDNGFDKEGRPRIKILISPKI